MPQTWACVPSPCTRRAYSAGIHRGAGGLLHPCGGGRRAHSLLILLYPVTNGRKATRGSLFAQTAGRIPTLCGLNFSDPDLPEYAACLQAGDFDILFWRRRNAAGGARHGGHRCHRRHLQFRRPPLLPPHGYLPDRRSRARAGAFGTQRPDAPGTVGTRSHCGGESRNDALRPGLRPCACTAPDHRSA